MSTIDKMLQAPAEDALPPAVRWLKSRLAAGDECQVELFTPESMLGSSATQLSILRKEGGKEQPPYQIEWDAELNSSLVQLGIRAIDLKNEGERFALGLRAALRKVERRYGDGYLSGVFVELIDESNLSRNGEIAEVRKFVHANAPDRSSRAYADCRDQIASEIGARAVELRDKLKYGEDDLKAIMSRAIALYLDERFSVTRRRAMGWV